MDAPQLAQMIEGDVIARDVSCALRNVSRYR
jgi:hypothetical protein